MHVESHESEQDVLVDTLQRPLRDLRISLTDRCNFRCTYCMPKEIFGPNFEFLRPKVLLTDDEIVRITRIFAGLGVNKIRLTGGEPLLRPGLSGLIQRISTIDGVRDISLTTNGSLLTLEKARDLKNAGLHRINVSLDALDDRSFMALNDVDFSVEKVLGAVEAADRAGLQPIKINMVVIKGINDHSVVNMAEHFRGTGYIVRFIEYMDVGNSNGWRLDQVVPAREIIARIDQKWPLKPIMQNPVGEVARRYEYEDGQGEIGVIASVTQPFCLGCTRARLSAEGRLFLCLFGTTGYDLRTRLRSMDTDDNIATYIRNIWSRRDDRYSELRSSQTDGIRKVEMSHIGG